MNKLVAIIGAALVAASAAAMQTPGALSAARPLVTTVHGIELLAHHTRGTFSGYSTGSLAGGWLALVDHTPLKMNATITGGTLTLLTSKNDFKQTLTGQFSSGTITNTNPGANCTNQTFRVVGNLSHFTGDHTGRFAVTLTHFRHSILGACVSYFATANGTLTLAQ